MNMVGHQAVGPDLYIKASTPLGQKSLVGVVVRRSEESDLLAIPALGDVVGNAWDYDSGYTGHHINRRD